MTPSRPSWDNYFLDITVAVAARADCRRARHGAIIVKNNRIAATGYNGSEPGGPSCLAGECPRAFSQVEHLDPDYSNCISLHAEQNAIAYANRADCEGATIYITGKSCDTCSKLIKAAGITRVVTISDDLSDPNNSDNVNFLHPLLLPKLTLSSTEEKVGPGIVKRVWKWVT